ncbi:hypothetical protein E1264_10775 [Actinomadura sp. KC216]|uniref:hypothetical protein n=1 Tax=Actinomadura sp. KC216 TaxID=2530370 RepID=UPI001052ADA8|nr:hypothetical protein [Actinomadura sp. KC216]TDB88615.1 hypothetical protein E1264_10775 [Actinomadura sp. KC216]
MRAAALAGAAGCGLAAAYVAAGTAGLVVAAAGLAVLGLVAARAAMPAALPPRRAARAPDEPDELREYPSYRRVREAVSWSQVSPRHFGSVTRPLLVRLFAAALAERHGVDVHREPARARELVGDDVWPFIDPDRPRPAGTAAPGPDLAGLRTVVNRLEELWPND